MASANRSRVESCSGGLELVQCPHYPRYKAYTRPHVELQSTPAVGRTTHAFEKKKKKLFLREKELF